MSDVEYRVMREEDKVTLREIVCKDFLPRDPLTKYVSQTDPVDGNIWCDTVFPCVKDGLSVVAVETETGRIVGHRFSGIVYRDKPDVLNFPKDDPKTRGLGLLYDFIQSLYKDVDLFAKYRVDELVNFRGLCVLEEYKQRGIAAKMVEMSLDLIRARGFRLVTVETSSRFSRRVYEKQEFENVVDKLYEETMIEGQPLKMTDELAYHRNYTLFVKTV